MFPQCCKKMPKVRLNLNYSTDIVLKYYFGIVKVTHTVFCFFDPPLCLCVPTPNCVCRIYCVPFHSAHLIHTSFVIQCLNSNFFL